MNNMTATVWLGTLLAHRSTLLVADDPRTHQRTQNGVGR